MTIHLIRHARASARTNGATDHDRTLDDDGRVQASTIADRLAGAPIKAILSSPAIRCLQTVEPLALALGLDIVSENALYEGDWYPALELVLSLARDSEDAVLCSHGDVVPSVLIALANRGVATDPEIRCGKGSVWTLETRAGSITRAHYRSSKALAGP